MKVRIVIQPESALPTPDSRPATLAITRKTAVSATRYVVKRASALFGHNPLETRACRQELRGFDDAMDCPDYRRLRTFPKKDSSRWLGTLVEGTGYTVAALR